MNTQTLLSKINLNTVTSEQIGRCHAVIGQDGKTFYQVESEQDITVEYQVTYSKEFGFRCTCRSGQVGFSNAKLGVCKHVVWSLACAAEVRTALAELENAQKAPTHYLEINGAVQTQEVVTALLNRKPTTSNKAAIAQNDRLQNKPFSFYR